MIIVRFIGWLLLAAAIIVLGRDLLAWRDTGVFSPISVEELWSSLARGSLERTQADVAPWIWSGIIYPFLRFWAALSLAAVALVLMWVARRQGPRRRR